VLPDHGWQIDMRQHRGVEIFDSGDHLPVYLPHMIDANMVGDRSNPRGEFRFTSEFSDIFKHPHENILTDILGILFPVHHAQHHVPYQVTVFIHQKPEGVGIAIAYLIDQCKIIHPED
jgi:hypothetical protein